jgi:hypothetical protein
VFFPCTIPPHMIHCLPSGQNMDPLQHMKFAIDYYTHKSNTLGVQLGVCVHHLQLCNRAKQLIEASHLELREELQKTQADLMECRAKLDQTDLVQQIWVPNLPNANKRRSADFSDTEASMLQMLPDEDDQASLDFLNQPLTVKRVACENGFKCGKKDLFSLSGHMYNSFIYTRGKPPSIKIRKDESGIPTTMCFLTERDRGLILAVLEKFGQRETSPATTDSYS